MINEKKVSRNFSINHAYFRINAYFLDRAYFRDMLIFEPMLIFARVRYMKKSVQQLILSKKWIGSFSVKRAENFSLKKSRLQLMPFRKKSWRGLLPVDDSLECKQS